MVILPKTHQTTCRVLPDCLYASVERQPDKVAVISDGAQHTYRDLLEAAERIAARLIGLGVERGDRVVLFMNNTWACVVSLYAVQLCGGVFVVVNPQTKAEKLSYLVADCSAVALITERGLQRAFGPLLKAANSLKAVVCSGPLDVSGDAATPVFDLEEALTQVPDPDVLDQVRPIAVDLAALIYTSGSTGEPKGVMHTHQSMLFAMASIIEYLRLSENDRIFCALPLAFDYGLYQLLMSVALGATLILERSFLYLGRVFDRMVEHRISVFPGVPSMFAMIREANDRSRLTFEHVTRVTNTAAALPAGYVPTLQEIFPNALIYKMYGLTECKRACYLEPEVLHSKPESVGRAIPGTEMFLLSPEGEPVRPGEKGILHVRGPHVMLGYWNKPQQTKKMLRQGRYDGERILCTHDWFYQDEEGLFYFMARSDDIIKTRGEKVSPREVENVLCGMPGIRDAAALGVPDATLGEAVRVFVSLQDGADLDERAIKQQCVNRLEGYMIPREIVILPDLPKTSTGKVDKKPLRDWPMDTPETPN